MNRRDMMEHQDALDDLRDEFAAEESAERRRELREEMEHHRRALFLAGDPHLTDEP